jgi:hypothetical protein
MNLSAVGFWAMDAEDNDLPDPHALVDLEWAGKNAQLIEDVLLYLR